MSNLADFLLSKISYRLPRHFYTYVKGVTPLSTDTSVLAALASYLVIIFSIQIFLKNRKPHKLTTLFQTHNILLSSGSLLVLALILEEVVPILWNHGIHYAICDENAWTPVSLVHIHTHNLLRSYSSFGLQRLEFYYLINYFFKFWELLDTIFLVLKKKPLRMCLVLIFI